LDPCFPSLARARPTKCFRIRRVASLTTIIVSSHMSLRSAKEGKAVLPRLLQRQKKLENLVAPWSTAYGLAEAIARGHCRSVKDLCLQPFIVQSKQEV